MNADTRLRKISLANLSNFKNEASQSRSPRLRLTHLAISKYGRAEDEAATVLNNLQSPVVHHIPIVLEEDFFSESRKTECYVDKLRSLRIRTDNSHACSGQKEDRTSGKTLHQSNSFDNRIKDSISKRPTINVDTFNKPPKNLPKNFVSTPGSKIYIHREDHPEPTCPLHGWKSNHKNTVPSHKVAEAKVSKRQNVGFGSLRVKKHSLDSKLTSKAENPFQRRWSLRVPESSSSRIILDDDSFKAPTLSSISRSNIGFLAEIPDYFKERKNARGDDKSESTHDIFSAALNREFRVNKTPTSASLNNSHATKGLLSRGNIQASPSNSGILKSPGKRRVSSSNRVDFLDNLQEKEIPCRQT